MPLGAGPHPLSPQLTTSQFQSGIGWSTPIFTCHMCHFHLVVVNTLVIGCCWPTSPIILVQPTSCTGSYLPIFKLDQFILTSSLVLMFEFEFVYHSLLLIPVNVCTIAYVACTTDTTCSPILYNGPLLIHLCFWHQNCMSCPHLVWMWCISMYSISGFRA
jgi:hypothetical protein